MEAVAPRRSSLFYAFYRHVCHVTAEGATTLRKALGPSEHFIQISAFLENICLIIILILTCFEMLLLCKLVKCWEPFEELIKNHAHEVFLFFFYCILQWYVIQTSQGLPACCCFFFFFTHSILLVIKIKTLLSASSTFVH